MAAYHPAGSAVAAAAAAGAAATRAGAATVAAATVAAATVAGVAAGAGAEDLYTCACMTFIRSRCVCAPVCVRCTDVCKRHKRIDGPQEGPNRIAEVLGVVHLNGEARLALHCHVWRPRMFGHTYTYTYIDIYI